MHFNEINFFLILVYFVIFLISLFLSALVGDFLFSKKIDKTLYEDIMITIFSFSLFLCVISFVGMIVVNYSNFGGKVTLNVLMSILSLFLISLPLFVIYETIEQNILAPSARQVIEVIQIVICFSGFVIFCSILPLYVINYKSAEMTIT